MIVNRQQINKFLNDYVKLKLVDGKWYASLVTDFLCGIEMNEIDLYKFQDKLYVKQLIEVNKDNQYMRTVSFRANPEVYISGIFTAMIIFEKGLI